jgi:predicted dehydrogenase
VPTIIPSSALGKGGAVAPSERLNIAAIGVGGRMNWMFPAWLGNKKAQVVAVCDCQKSRAEAGRKRVNKHYGNNDCKKTGYIQEILANDQIDGVVIATGDRMHTVVSIMAAKAGKDVYCEKPHSMTIKEGRAMVNTCERLGTVYQCGHQRHSVDVYAFLVEVVKRGLIGNVHTANIKVWNNGFLGPQADQPAPADLDWDTWLGPSPYHPFNWARFRNGAWNVFWETGGGCITNMACHYTDIAQWAFGTEDTGPVHYSGTANFNPHNFADTPITSHTTCTYKDGKKIVIDQSGSPVERAITFVGDEGWIKFAEANGSLTGEPKSLLRLRGKMASTLVNSNGHAENFLTCMKTRQRTVCYPENSHRATSISHITNLCARLGRDLNWNPDTERFINDDQANRMLSRALRAPFTLA